MHVLVIGAGVFGSWTALWLRRRGASVTLVDQYGAGNALSSSGDESRVTRSAHGADDLYPRWQRRALQQWLDLDPSLFVRAGVTWFVADDDAFETESLTTLERLGIPAERLEADAAARRWPQISLDGVRWVLWEPDAGALLARRAVAATVRRFVEEGGSYRIGHGGLDQDGVVVEIDGECPTFHSVVFACGPWLPTVLPGVAGLDLAVTRQEVIYFATPPGDARFDAAVHPIWVEHGASIYGLPSIEHRGFKVAPDWPGPRTDPDRQDRRLSDGMVAAARSYLGRRFPALADRPVAEGRVCQYELTPDTHFLIDRVPEHAGLNAWVVGGGSGHGFKHGPVVGEVASALVLGEPSGKLWPSDGRFALKPRVPSAGMRTAALSEDAG